MREFRDPATLGILKAIGTVVSIGSTVSGLFGGSGGQTQQVSSAGDEEAREAKAREEAERKQAAEDKARQGRRRTLVVPPTQGALSSNIQSHRNTLRAQPGTAPPT